MASGCGALAVLLIQAAPLRQRRNHAACVVILATFTGLASGYSGSSNHIEPDNNGATSGQYVVSVTGSSGSQKQTAQVHSTLN